MNRCSLLASAPALVTIRAIHFDFREAMGLAMAYCGARAANQANVGNSAYRAGEVARDNLTEKADVSDTSLIISINASTEPTPLPFAAQRITSNSCAPENE